MHDLSNLSLNDVLEHYLTGLVTLCLWQQQTRAQWVKNGRSEVGKGRPFRRAQGKRGLRESIPSRGERVIGKQHLQLTTQIAVNYLRLVLI